MLVLLAVLPTLAAVVVLAARLYVTLP